MKTTLLFLMLALSMCATSQSVLMGNASLPSRTEFYYNSPSRVVAGAMYGKSLFRLDWDTVKVTSVNCDSCIVISVNGALRPYGMKPRNLIPTTIKWDSVTLKPALVYPSDTIGIWKPIGWQPDLTNYFTKAQTEALIPIPQTLSLSGNTLSISSGNSVTLPSNTLVLTPTQVTRAFNTNFTVTKATFATYSIEIINGTSLISATEATAYLEYSTNGGTTWITVAQISREENGLSVIVAAAKGSTFVLSGFIPSAATVRIRTVVGTGSTVTYIRGQEVAVN